MQTSARHLEFHGRVQGVGFRHFIMHTALDLRITGWVRNRADGRVEAVVCGTPDAVHTMLERVRHGPAYAAVTKFEVTDVHETFERFEMRPTE